MDGDGDGDGVEAGPGMKLVGRLLQVRYHGLLVELMIQLIWPWWRDGMKWD